MVVNGTTGTDNVTFTPTFVDSANITGAGPVPISVDNTEHVIYANLGGADLLTVNGTSQPDTLTYNPSIELGSGSFHSGFSPTFDYSVVAGVTFNGGGGYDIASIEGSDGPETVTSTAAVISLSGAGYLGKLTIGTGVDQVNVKTFGGNDNINLDLNVNGLQKYVDAGDGNDTVDLSGTIDATIIGGLGDDNIIGSPAADTIYGDDPLGSGGGNDTISGGGGGDYINGGDGNDTINGDAGDDTLLGGPGFDKIDPGTGADTVDGGPDGSDWLVYNNTTATTISLRNSAGQLRVDNGANVTLASNVSQVLFNDTAAAGVALTVHDLSGMKVDRVGIDHNGAGQDTITVDGTAGADNIALGRALTNPNGNQQPAVITGWGTVIAGTGYNVAEGDRFVVNGLEGADSIIAARSVMDPSVVPGSLNSMLVSLYGGDGDDYLSVDSPAGQTGSFLQGDGGNDTLVGGRGDDFMYGDFGGPSNGDDVFIGNGGTDKVGAGGGLLGDTILVPGTPGNDNINLALDAGGHLLVTVNGVTTTYQNGAGGPINASGMEKILVQGGAGADKLTVDSTNGAIPLAITYDGGADNDSLTLTGGVATFDSYTPGPNPGQGLSTLIIGLTTQTVNFQNIEPVFDLVGGPLIVNGTNADNAINYSDVGDTPFALVSIDNSGDHRVHQQVHADHQRLGRQRHHQPQQPDHAERSDFHHGQRRRSDSRQRYGHRQRHDRLGQRNDRPNDF